MTDPAKDLTPEEIFEKMKRDIEALPPNSDVETLKVVERTIRQAVEAEREACAAVLERQAFYFEGNEPVRLVPSETGEKRTHICAAAIRARGGGEAG